MQKAALVLLFSIGLLAASDQRQCACMLTQPSKTQKIMLNVAFGLSTITIIPIVVPISMAASTCSAAAAVSAKAGAALASTTAMSKIGLGLVAVKIARPYVLQTTEEELNALLKEKAARSTKAKDEFVKCLKSYKNSLERNSLGRPQACEEAALLYAFSAGPEELDRRTKAFNDEKCFCS